ncbi:MAG: class II aldolase/adducin family protein, partial [Gemmataceae bacterium]|nr:class II aldolase/adducin family protein [Gemmataceae bacterium]
VSKGYMKPEDICKVDNKGNQLAGKRKRTSEVLLHLSIYNQRPDINAVVHCHPPHATAFAVAHEPIPKCVLPEVEVFLGEVPIAVYETPGAQAFADTVAPYAKDCNTILLANHGTITFGPDLENAYFNTEIIDSYCRILILSRQLGRVNYFTEQQTRELLALKKRLGYDDVRFRHPESPMCGESSFDEKFSKFQPRQYAFRNDTVTGIGPDDAVSYGGTQTQADDPAFETLVRTITDQVMRNLQSA